MSALPQTIAPPEYLPARMLNEFSYCPRLFFYEWVEGLFRDSADTVEGRILHARVDKPGGDLPEAEALTEGDKIHSRSVTMSSVRLGLIARLDLIEADGGAVTPVDYKRGKPRDGKNGLELWEPDRVQLAAQCLVLRDNGYQCEEGVVYYAKTRQRVRVEFDDNLVTATLRALDEARATAAAGMIPMPLEDSPKCGGCSLAGICLPDETNSLAGEIQGAEQLSLFASGAPPRKAPGRDVRRLVTPRDDLKPVYLNTQGLRVGKSGEVLQVKEKDAVVQQIRIGEVCQVNLMGNVQVSSQAMQTLLESQVPVCYFSMGGWFYGIAAGLNSKNVFLRRAQYRLAEEEWFARGLASRLVVGKIKNQRTMLQRNHIEPPAEALLGLKQMAEAAERAQGLEELLGIEGNAARIYFAHFGGMIKAGDEGDESSGELRFDFEARNRRPPRDPVNALLSLAYSVLAKDLTLACYAVGFDPMLGYYHQPRYGRPALALDLMEPFRPLIGDSAVLSAINTRMVTERDFVKSGGAVALTAAGRKGFFRAYELRMDTLATHPLFDYRVTYRRMLEIQARLLARVLEGEIGEYPVFTTR